MPLHKVRRRVGVSGRDTSCALRQVRLPLLERGAQGLENIKSVVLPKLDT